MHHQKTMLSALMLAPSPVVAADCADFFKSVPSMYVNSDKDRQLFVAYIINKVLSHRAYVTLRLHG